MVAPWSDPVGTALILAGAAVSLALLASSWVVATAVRTARSPANAAVTDERGEVIDAHALGVLWAQSNEGQAILNNADQKTRQEIEDEGAEVEAHLTPYAEMPAHRGEEWDERPGDRTAD